MRICVYGASSCVFDSKYIKAGEELAEYLGENGHSLVFGAGANGMMGAAARGFKRKNAEIIGVVPSFFNVDGIIFDGCTKLIRTETMRERKQIMEDNADAFIIAPGGIGTYEEFFEILTLKQLCRHNKPIVVYNLFGYYDKMIEMLEYSVSEKTLSPESMKLFYTCDTPEDANAYIEKNEHTVREVKDLKHIFTKG